MEQTTFVLYILELCVKLSPLLLAIAALLGLQTWRKKMQFSERIGVSSRLLTAVYKFEETVRMVRSPFISWQEYAAKEKDSSAEDTEFAYRNRLNILHEVVGEIQAVKFEVRVIFGKAIYEDVNDILQTYRELRAAYESYYAIDKHLRDDHPKLNDDFMRIMMRYSSDDNMELDLATKVAKLETGVQRKF